MTDQYISVGEARSILRVSKSKMTAMIDKGEIAAVVDPLDKRKKRIKRSDVEAIKKQSEAIQ